ncbi:MAG: helix-turn-helix domain-containing protein [Sporichthyaceae bacterium]
MDVGEMITKCRMEARLSLRALAEKAGTSHSTLLAYEAGRKSPSTTTLARILDATGYRLTLNLERKPLEFDPDVRDREIVGLLELAQLFPATHNPMLEAPIFRRR